MSLCRSFSKLVVCRDGGTRLPKRRAAGAVVQKLQVGGIVLDIDDLRSRCCGRGARNRGALGVRACNVVYSWQRGVVRDVGRRKLLVGGLVVDVVGVDDARLGSGVFAVDAVAAVLAKIHQLVAVALGGLQPDV